MEQEAYKCVAKNNGNAEALQYCYNVCQIVKEKLLSLERTINNDVLFFPSDVSVDRLTKLIASATSSISICVNTIHNDSPFYNAILHLLSRGISVNIITDADHATSLNTLITNGVPVKVGDRSRSNRKMTNMFCVVDNRFVMTGSFNWRGGKFLDNNDNVFITDDPKMVAAYGGEFNRLWVEK